MDVGAVLPGVYEPEALIGKILDNRYRLLERLGEGGMGTVYRAEHVVLGQQVAVKLLSPRFAYDREWVQRFLIEARAARRIQHPHIVQILDVAIAGPGIVFMVMELLAGETLSSLVRREGPLPWPRAFAIVGQIAAALAAAHASGVVHRDVKPANCIVTVDPPGVDHVKVLDFGIAKFTEARDSANSPETVTGMWLGTSEYMAPEMYRGEPASPSMDIYALGALLYKLLTGVTPFRGDHMQVATQQHQRDVTPPSRIVALPAAVDAVVVRALARDALARTPSMAALTAEMAAALAQPPAPEPAVAPAGPAEADLDEPEAVTTVVASRREESPTTERAVGTSFVRRNLLHLITASSLLCVLLVFSLIASYSPRTEESAPRSSEDTPVDAAPPAPTPAPMPTPTPAEPPAPTPASEPPTEPASSTRTRAGPSSKKRSAKKKSAALPAAVTAPILRTELMAMNRTIQDKCFKINRAVAGTRVPMDITVDAAGKASAKLTTPKYAVFGDCIDFWLRRHAFPASRTGGQIQYVFIAE